MAKTIGSINILSKLFMLSIATAAFTATAADGTISFTGTILDSACTVDTDTVSKNVILGEIPKSSFKSAGDVAAATKFSIELKNCPGTVKTASIKFDGTPDLADSSILKLSSGQTAKGVGVAFFEEDGITPIPLATPSKSVTLNSAFSDSQTTPIISTKMNFVAKYKATRAVVEAGTANATSDFTITYQ